MICLHTCQLSRIICESPGYGTYLPLSCMGHQISQIKKKIVFWPFLRFSLRFIPFFPQLVVKITSVLNYYDDRKFW